MQCVVYLTLGGKIWTIHETVRKQKNVDIYLICSAGQDVEPDDWQDGAVRPPRAGQGGHRAGGRAAAGHTGAQVTSYLHSDIYDGYLNTGYWTENVSGASTSCTRWPCKWSTSSPTWRRVASATTAAERGQHRLDPCLLYKMRYFA